MSGLCSPIKTPAGRRYDGRKGFAYKSQLIKAAKVWGGYDDKKKEKAKKP